jgi:hypothetical protein
VTVGVIWATAQIGLVVALLVGVCVWLVGSSRQKRPAHRGSDDLGNLQGEGGHDSFADRHAIAVVLIPVGIVGAFVLAAALYVALAWPGFPID